jgi:predicted dehydrogenase
VKRRICVVGCGRWGKNHARTLAGMGCLAGILETNNCCLAELTEKYKVAGFHRLEEAIEEGFDGYIVATPAQTHYPIGKALLERGFSVLIEKPMALSAQHARELVEVAKKSGARLMVGHLLLFHPAIRKIKAVIEEGKIGQLYYIYSTRLNLGTVRTEENVFWSFAPHDISVIDYLIGTTATKIEAKGLKFLQDNIYDVTMTQFTYPGNIHAHIFVSWLHPFKEQRLVVVGSGGMISFDDSSAEKNILYYNKKIGWDNGRPVKIEKPDEIIAYEQALPLDEELKYFVANLDQGFKVASGETGMKVVEVLEKVQELISEQ